MELIKSDIAPLHGIATSMQGGRPENQDAWGYLDTPVGFLLIVCDGMGGGPGGKTASYIAKREIAAALCECNAQTPREHALKMAVARAQDAMEKTMQDDASLNGMGSTIVALLINRQSAFVAYAGDSRCYRLRGKKILYRTQDHSLVAELVRKNALTEEEARLSPQSNVISRGLGSISNHVPNIEEIPYRKGDRLVLCTDGVWGSMPQKELVNRFSETTDLQNLANKLSTEIDRIGFSKGGGHDNHTMAIIDMDADSVLKDKKGWSNIIPITLSVCLAFIIILSLIFFTYSKWKNKKDKTNKQISIEYPIPMRYAMRGASTNQADDEDQSENISGNEDSPANTMISDSLREVIKKFVEEKQYTSDTIKQAKQDTTKQNQPDTTKGDKKRKTEKTRTSKTTPKDATAFISASIDSLHDTREKSMIAAVKKQDAHIAFIKSKLVEIRKNDNSRRKKADMVLGQIKYYRNINKVCEDVKLHDTYIPTERALNEMDDLKKRINWINK